MAENLSKFEMEIVLKFLLHHMTMELRYKFMETFPTMYNKLYGREIMEVKKKSED